MYRVLLNIYHSMSFRFAILPLLLFAAVVAPAAAEGVLTLKFHSNPGTTHFGCIDLRGLATEKAVQLQKRNLTQAEWQHRFLVHTAGDDTAEPAPSVIGRYEVLDDGVRFMPRFAPMPGVAYRVWIELPGHAPMKRSFAVGHEVTEPPVVTAVYPSGPIIPENTLRLYVHFSQPMRRGQAARCIRLLDEEGDTVEAPFLTGPVGELWDSENRRLTLLLDPGRTKRGVGPNRRLGPAMAAGKRRTLHIVTDMRDVHGRPMLRVHCKTYTVAAPINQAIQPAAWKLTPPAAGSRESLRVKFPVALDHGMLTHALRIFGVGGNLIRGKIAIDAQETLWLFTPSVPWEIQTFTLRIPTNLEDPSGNNLTAPLDVKVDDSGTRPHLSPHEKFVTLNFTPRHVIR